MSYAPLLGGKAQTQIGILVSRRSFVSKNWPFRIVRGPRIKGVVLTISIRTG